MSTSDDLELIDSVTRVTQIIAGSLITGVLVFLGIAFAIDPLGGAHRSNIVARLTGAPAQAPAAAPDANAAPPPAAGPIDVGEMLTWMALGVTAVGLALSYLIPGWMVDRTRQAIAAGKWPPPGLVAASSPFGPEALKSDTGKLALLYQQQFIVGAALNEGAAFFVGVAYMLGRDPVALGLAVLLLVALAARFPTRLRLASWIDRQQESLALDRQAAL
jgi:hypothetical protein